MKANLSLALASQGHSIEGMSEMLAVHSRGSARESNARDRASLLSGQGRSSVIKEAPESANKVGKDDQPFPAAQLDSIEKEVEQLKKEEAKQEREVEVNKFDDQE